MGRREGATASQVAQTWCRVWDSGIRTRMAGSRLCTPGTNTGQGPWPLGETGVIFKKMVVAGGIAG